MNPHPSRKANFLFSLQAKKYRELVSSVAHPLPRWLVNREMWLTMLSGLLLFAVLFTTLRAVQFSTPNLIGNDGYYHIKLAYLMRTEGLKPAFPWLPFTILNEGNFVDHHFLFHVFLVPFTNGNLIDGAKTASALFPALTFLAIWWLLRSQRVPLSALWALALLSISEAFLYRMSMPRAQSLSLAVLVLGLHFLWTGKHRWLFPLGFFYVWLYNAFPLLLVVVGFYTGAEFLVHRRIVWKPFAFVLAGLTMGIIVNPYFPDNLVFIYNHLAPKLLNPTEGIRVGSEWYPYNTEQLMGNSGLALVLLVAGVVGLGFNKQRMDTKTASSLFMALFSLFLVFQSRRFIEYFPAFALIFAAIALAPNLKIWWDGIRGSQDAVLPDYVLLSPALHGIIVGVIGLGWLLSTYFNLQALSETFANTKPYERFEQASDWLADHTPAGTRVFHTDWDDFTYLFFHNTHNTYLTGLDPTYMQIYDPELYDLWRRISQGKLEQPSQEIAESFGANFIITDLDHESFLKKAELDPNLTEMYRDEFAVVFQIEEK